MKYKDEDTQGEFHSLDTDLQLSFNDFEMDLADEGLFMQIDEVESGDHLEIVIRISNQSNSHSTIM